MDLSPRFDSTLNAWVLSRYRDVQAALRHPGLSAGTVDPVEHQRFRDSARIALAPSRAAELLQTVPLPTPPTATFDLLQDVATPWCLSIAAGFTGLSGRDLSAANRLAAQVFLAAAEPFDENCQTAGRAATGQLAVLLRDPLAVQTFVALSQTIPCFLASAWLALLQFPGPAADLVARPETLPEAMEELFRYASPASAQFRRAVQSVQIEQTRIEAGERVVLRLADANRDPEVFPNPATLDFRRRPVVHLGFGAGPHACAGAALVRTLALAATGAFLGYLPGIALDGEVEWQPWYGIRSPVAVRVHRRA